MQFLPAFLALLFLAACDDYPEHSVVVNSTDALVETCYGTLCGYIEDGIYTFKEIYKQMKKAHDKGEEITIEIV